jgi:hypothetical protein
MWSRFLAYQEAERRPNMLFMTKSEMLKDEVEKSFQNMGLVLAHKTEKFNSYPSREHEQRNPMFVTSSEWLDMLDVYLPGERFFTKKEAKYRAAFRLGGDLRRTVESLLEQDCELDQDELNREEMTYPEFRKFWPKMNNSKPKSKIDPALVWMEIKSYIKGSLEALHLDSGERDDPMHRFLSEVEYLSLGKKQSRLDEGQRKEVYHFYLKYEKLKKVENRYDEMDLIYNLVGRVAKMQDDSFTEITTCPLFHIDCVFVDEVQDFTIAELYLLTKLSRDPDNCKSITLIPRAQCLTNGALTSSYFIHDLKISSFSDVGRGYSSNDCCWCWFSLYRCAASFFRKVWEQKARVAFAFS